MSFEDFIKDIGQGAFTQFAAKNLKEDPLKIEYLLGVYLNEARIGYRLIEKYLIPKNRFLEVGAGLGILSAYLLKQGFKVVALEPSGEGFDLNYRIGKELGTWLELSNYEFLNLKIEDCHSAQLGLFDCIYSINVLEHLPDLDTAFERMELLLGPQGAMVHTCPNYHVPYDPHFGLVLVPAAPWLTKFFLSRKIANSDLWGSINFVSWSWLKRIGRRRNLKMNFRSGVMHQSLIRMKEDPIFAKRQARFVTFIYNLLLFTGILSLVKYWPSAISTPLIVECHRKEPSIQKALQSS